MKKNLLKYIAGWILTGCLLPVFSGCTDVLDTQPFDKISEDIVWSTRANVDAFVYTTYNNIVSSGYGYIEYVNEEQWTPNSVHIDGCVESREGFDRNRDFGFDKFGDIRRCNLIIEKVQNSTVLVEKDKTELVAEAKFLRAMIYYYMVKRFGIFVWVPKIMSIDDDFQIGATPDVATSYSYVIKDLEDAIAGLPETPQIDRANRYTAYALLSRACLQAAAYTGDESYYQKAIDASNAVINSGKYSLETDFESMFNEVKPKSGEIIFGKYRLSLNTARNSIADFVNIIPGRNNDVIARAGASPLYTNLESGYSGWLFWTPTQDLVNEYEVIDQVTGEAKEWDKTSQFLASVQQDATTDVTMLSKGHVTDGSRVNELMYQYRDKRFYGTIIYDSCEFRRNIITTCILGNQWRLVGGSMQWHYGISNYLWRKGASYTVTAANMNYHWVVFRLGEMYLNKAEALLRQEKIAEAVETFNLPRTVHGGLPPVATTVSAEAAWKAYKRERRVEMAKEGDYYWSLLRWGKYGGDANHGIEPGGTIPELTTAPSFIEITKDRKSYTIEEITHSQNNVRIFSADRRYLFPIPQGQREANPNLGQNPGW